jgi:hypothetical protein
LAYIFQKKNQIKRKKKKGKNSNKNSESICTESTDVLTDQGTPSQENIDMKEEIQSDGKTIEILSSNNNQTICIPQINHHIVKSHQTYQFKIAPHYYPIVKLMIQRHRQYYKLSSYPHFNQEFKLHRI